MANGSVEKLAVGLGHSSTEVTRPCAHFSCDAFQVADRPLPGADLRGQGSFVVSRGRRAVDLAEIGQLLKSRPPSEQHGIAGSVRNV
jgi:hypothetical protein